uniref:Uncharacterized protein n=1 Tax=Anguilla anguilla TaxID=7936 RepID=A0A0E9XAF5_ANGAN
MYTFRKKRVIWLVSIGEPFLVLYANRYSR